MFTIRVYGLLINEKKQVLVSDEFIRGGQYTKFPGGGLEFGEGTRECVVREFKEELDLAVEAGEHFYTTDFFQISAFNNRDQIISIYYYVHPLEPIKAVMNETAFAFNEKQLEVYASTGETETFRLIDWDNFSEETVTLPIDKVVARMLKAK